MLLLLRQIEAPGFGDFDLCLLLQMVAHPVEILEALLHLGQFAFVNAIQTLARESLHDLDVLQEPVSLRSLSARVQNAFVPALDL